MTRSALFVVSGPSGAGKGTLIARVLERVDNVWLSISATTRRPRAGEVDGVSYRFLTVEQFEEGIAADAFVEWAQVHSNYYGTPVAPIQQHLHAGELVILEIDVQGAFQVREKFPRATLVFIAPPSLSVLEKRLRGRGTDTPAVIEQRLINAQGEMRVAKDYDVLIVNDDLEKATDELVKVLES